MTQDKTLRVIEFQSYLFFFTFVPPRVYCNNEYKMKNNVFRTVLRVDGLIPKGSIMFRSHPEHMNTHCATVSSLLLL